MFFSLHRHTDEWFFKDFWRFSKTSPQVTQTLPKLSDDFRRLPKTFEEDTKMFQSYTNDFKYNLRDKLDISEIMDIYKGCLDLWTLF